MKNLYQELESVLTNNSKTFDDILWVGTKDFYVPTESFLTKIKDIYYDNDAGVIEISPDLIIMGDNWYLKRKFSLSGAEGWEFVDFITKPKVERTDISNYCIRDYVDENGFRILNSATSLSDLNPEPLQS
mgnify:CR=1 FL=1